MCVRVVTRPSHCRCAADLRHELTVEVCGDDHEVAEHGAAAREREHGAVPASKGREEEPVLMRPSLT